MTQGRFQMHICDVLSGKNGIQSQIPQKNYLSIACSSPSESSHLSLHACYRSLSARGPLIDSRDCVNSLRALWSIRTPRPSCANQDAWAVITLKLPEGEFYSHIWIGTPPCNIVREAVLLHIHLPPQQYGFSSIGFGILILEFTFNLKVHIWWPSFNLPGS